MNPTAKAALSVRVKIPLAAVSWARGTTSGIIESSAGAKNVVAIETRALSTKTTSRFVSKSASDEEEAGPHEVRHDQHEPPVEAVDVDAGQRAEDDRRRQEGQDQQTETALFEPVSAKTRTVSP